MRKILFRGKRIDNGEWIQGDLVQFPAHGIVRIVEQEPSYKDAEVDLDTVGQFTGLTDKNGKKIFEGDIIFDPELKENHIVMFDEGGFCTEEMFLQFYLCFDEMEVEVIGNIHDNPELLEVTK
jgi:uncharacterized phage protein (TIGR01671 family)